MGVGVAAEPIVGLVEGDSVTSGQDVSRGETGYSAADDGDRPARRGVFLMHTSYS